VQHINYGLLSIITIISFLIGCHIGLRKGNSIYADPENLRVIRVLKKIVQDAQETQKSQKDEQQQFEMKSYSKSKAGGYQPPSLVGGIGSI